MKKLLLTTLLFFAAYIISYGQDPCSYGTVSEMVGIGENISTGGLYEYAGAADFDVPFGTNFTVNQITFDAIKTEDQILYVNLSFLEETEGLPGASIQNFDNLVPTSQEFLYEAGEFDAYTIVLDLPTSITFEKGKYFISLSANPGTGPFVAWDVTGDFQTYGVFDYNKFENEDWGGTGYYNKVFQVVGTCEDSGEVMPNYGDVCEQENLSNNHETGTTFLNFGEIVSIADDFIVPENTTFYLTDFEMDALLLGGGMHNATINIRTSDGNTPSDIIHSYTRKSPAFEQFGEYWPFPGSPFDVAAIKIGFTFEEPIVLNEGTYFIEVIPTQYATEFLTWEAMSEQGIGGFSYSSFDGGNSWIINNGINQIFKVEGFCAETLETETPNEFVDFQFFPNPVTEVLNISTKTKIKHIELYSIVGQKVAEYNSHVGAINMASLSGGIYLLKVKFDGGQVETFKIVKE